MIDVKNSHRGRAGRIRSEEAFKNTSIGTDMSVTLSVYRKATKY
jgi:hypothetical protein